jgi:hypothetical protein
LPRVRQLGCFAVLAVLAGGVAGCGGSSNGDGPAPTPVLGVKGKERRAAPSLGFPGFATKNTTRVGGADPVADAAAVALAVFPPGRNAPRPDAVALADARDWRPATAAAALMGAPVRAPLLLSTGDAMPRASQEALKRLRPKGSEAAGGGEVIAVGRTPKLGGRKVTRIAPKQPGPYELAAAVDRFLTTAKGKPSDAVMVVSADEASFGVPAAGYAAKTGVPVLFVKRDSVPEATRRALLTHARPRIYVLGPPSSVGPQAIDALKKTGTVVRIGADKPVENAIAFARYTDGTFGWGVIDPGHGFVFTSARRPLDGPAAAALAASGTYGPIMLLEKANVLPKAVREYLLDIRPGYRKDPVRGVYNRGWMIGDRSASSQGVQSQIDDLLEIQRVRTTP